MSQRRIRLRPVAAAVSFTEISPSKRQRRRKCVQQPQSTLVEESQGPSSPPLSSSPDTGYSEIFSTTDSFLSDPTSSSQKQRSYSLRQERLSEAWSQIREQLRTAFIESSVPNIGATCNTCNQMAVVICQQCGPQVTYCEECTESHHLTCNIFHRPQMFQGDMLIPYKFKNARALRRNDHSCPSLCTREIICLDESGYQHAVSVSTCTCEPEAVTLARFRMWPSTPSKPTLAFHYDLLLWMECITLEGCIGADAFCRALQCRVGSTISHQFCQIYPAIIDAFEEFRFARYELNTLGFMSSELNNKVVCPACPKEKGTQILSFDALFGLCRKKHAGVSVRPPLFSTTFFESQGEVDRFVEEYDSSSSIPDQGCHQFLAGDTLRSKRRFAALDETAVFGSICRHEFPQRFINLKHGERLAYITFLLEKMKSNSRQLNRIVLYDVACTLEQHLKVVFTFCKVCHCITRSAFLNYVESWETRSFAKSDLGYTCISCVWSLYKVPGKVADSSEKRLYTDSHHILSYAQLSYSPRVLTNCGLTDGEATERLWSYLRRLSKMTKEMRPSHRIDVLTSGLLHYASKASHKLGVALPKRLKRAEETIKKMASELSEISDGSQGTITAERIEEFCQEQVSFFSNDPPTSYGQRHKLLQQIFCLARQRKFLLQSKSRYADGQSIALKLAKQISSTTDSLKRAISRFNIHPKDQFEGTLYSLPQTLQWQSVVDLEGIVNVELSANVRVTADIASLCRAVRVLQLKQRAQEEVEIVKEDMRRCIHFRTAEHSLLCTHLNRIRGGIQTRYNKGCLNLLFHRLLQCEITLNHYSKVFEPHILYDYPTCSLALSLINSGDTNNAEYDTLDLEDHSSLELSPDISDDESSSESSAEECLS